MTPETRRPYSYIAHFNGAFAGASVARADAATADFVATFIRDGLAILTTFSREEHAARADELRVWCDADTAALRAAEKEQSK